MTEQGKAIIFSAPSGAGKTTIVRHILSQVGNLRFSVSAASRERRGQEKDGVDYHFLSLDEFQRRVANGDFVEWEEVYQDHMYGTLKSEISAIWQSGNHVIFDVDVIGGMNLKKYFGDQALSIFVKAPTLGHLRARLEARQTETAEKIDLRMAKSEKEMAYAEHFDYILLNDELDRACSEATQVVETFLKS